MNRREAMQMAGAVALGSAATHVAGGCLPVATQTFYNFRYILRICPEDGQTTIYVQGSGTERVRESVEQVVAKINAANRENQCFVELTPIK